MKWTFYLLIIALIILSCFSNTNNAGKTSKGISKKAKKLWRKLSNTNWKSIIYDLTKRRVKQYFQRDNKDQCEKIKDKSKVSADKKVSPIKPFGYPTFDMYNRKKGFTMISPQTSLSQFKDGLLQPIKVGERDFYFVGNSAELLKFCDCFQKYDVIGQTLRDNGKFEDGGYLQIQLENIQSWSAGKDPNLFEMIFKMSLDRIVKELNPRQIIKDKIGVKRSFLDFMNVDPKNDVKANLLRFKEKFNEYKHLIPVKDSVLSKLSELVAGVDKIGKAGGKSAEQIVKDMAALLTEKKVGKNELNKWYEEKNLSKKGVIIGVFTMYAKPPNNLRTTYTFDKYKVSMKEVGDALKKIFKK